MLSVSGSRKRQSRGLIPRPEGQKTPYTCFEHNLRGGECILNSCRAGLARALAPTLLLYQLHSAMELQCADLTIFRELFGTTFDYCPARGHSTRVRGLFERGGEPPNAHDVY